MLLRVAREEPIHRDRLWRNIRMFVPGLRNAGFIVVTARDAQEALEIA